MNALFRLSEPAATRFDLYLTIAGFPVRIHPWFWVMALLFGGSNNEISRLLIWIAVVFGSVLLHELGHALALRRFGQSVHIVLHGGGGLAVAEPIAWGKGWAGVALSPRQKILVSAAGPAAGLALAGLVLLVTVALGGTVLVERLGGIVPWVSLDLPSWLNAFEPAIGTLWYVNVAWNVLNLMPVYPLDGGQIARAVLLKIDPLMGVTQSLWLSFILGLWLAAAGIVLFRSPYLTLLFALLAVQSYQAARGRVSQAA